MSERVEVIKEKQEHDSFENDILVSFLNTGNSSCISYINLKDGVCLKGVKLTYVYLYDSRKTRHSFPLWRFSSLVLAPPLDKIALWHLICTFLNIMILPIYSLYTFEIFFSISTDDKSQKKYIG